MKKCLILLILTLLSSSIKCQLIKPDSLGMECYKRGSELLKYGHYQLADSLFTLAMETYRNGNVYFNRAVSRLMTGDSAGFCDDIWIAGMNYFDEESLTLYNQHCCKDFDTIYYDKKLNRTGPLDYRYYEIIRVFKFKNLTHGTFHDKKHNGADYQVDYAENLGIIGYFGKATDMIAAYYIDEKGKYYIKSNKPIKIYNTDAFVNLMDRACLIFGTKYNYLKEDHHIDKLSVSFELFIDEQGEVKSVNLWHLSPDLQVDSLTRAELVTDFQKIVDQFPRITPAKFFNTPVAFTGLLNVDF